MTSLPKFILIPACLLAVFSAQAEFRYEQTTKITGGAMAGMMKLAGAFSAKAREPIVSTIMVKGDRMATITRDNIHVIDLSSETMTDIDLAKKTYSVITFAEMSESMKRMAEKMGQNKGQADVNFKADIKQTGQSRVISGLNTTETILTLTVEGTDAKSGQSGSMNMEMDMWLAPNIPGYKEVRDFHARMASKLAWSPMASSMGAMAQNQKGMAELMKNASKLDGVPVLQITRMGGVGGPGMPSDAGMANAQRESGNRREQDASEAAAEAGRRQAINEAARSAGRLGGVVGAGLGGLGGFGRKKKAPEQQQASAPPPPAPSAPPSGSGSSGSLMEMTTELTGFASSGVDSSRFDVPGGFKQVDHEMKKALR